MTTRSWTSIVLRVSSPLRRDGVLLRSTRHDPLWIFLYRHNDLQSFPWTTCRIFRSFGSFPFSHFPSWSLWPFPTIVSRTLFFLLSFISFVTIMFLWTFVVFFPVQTTKPHVVNPTRFNFRFLENPNKKHEWCKKFPSEKWRVFL